jgi:hypothetical protein
MALDQRAQLTLHSELKVKQQRAKFKHFILFYFYLLNIYFIYSELWEIFFGKKFDPSALSEIKLFGKISKFLNLFYYFNFNLITIY